LLTQPTPRPMSVHGGGTPTYADYLEGARYIFNVAFGPLASPGEGDTNVYGVLVDNVVIARFEELREHFARRLTA